MGRYEISSPTVSRCLWPGIDSVGTGLRLGLDKTNLRLITGFIMGHCKITPLTVIWNRSQPDYCKVWEQLELIEVSSVTPQPLISWRLLAEASSMV